MRYKMTYLYTRIQFTFRLHDFWCFVRNTAGNFYSVAAITEHNACENKMCATQLFPITDGRTHNIVVLGWYLASVYHTITIIWHKAHYTKQSKRKFIAYTMCRSVRRDLFFFLIKWTIHVRNTWHKHKFDEGGHSIFYKNNNQFNLCTNLGYSQGPIYIITYFWTKTLPDLEVDCSNY